MIDLHTATTERLIEERDGLNAGLSNFMPVGRITDPVQRRAAQANLVKVNRELAKRDARRRSRG